MLIYKEYCPQHNLALLAYHQWRSQPADLVLLCKFSRVH